MANYGMKRGLFQMYINEQEYVRWDNFVEHCGIFKYLSNKKDKTYILVIFHKDMSIDEIASVHQIEMDLEEREYLFKSDSYITYRYKPNQDNRRKKEVQIVKYDIYEKVFDCNNNVVFFADIDVIDMGSDMPGKVADFYEKAFENCDSIISDRDYNVTKILKDDDEK